MLDPKRYRARAQEFLRLRALTQNAEIAERYKDLADAYNRLAEREEELSSDARRGVRGTLSGPHHTARDRG